MNVGTHTKTTKLMSFRLPHAVADQLQRAAAATGQSMSSIVAAALQKHFEGYTVYIVDDVNEIPGQIAADELLQEGEAE